MSANSHIHFLPQDQPALVQIARQILETVDERPNLTNVSVIVNESRLIPSLRHALLDAAQHNQQPALLGPRFYSLEQWLAVFMPDDLNVCDDQVRLLILVEALLDSPRLLKQANPWALADSLLQLFDELTLNQIDIAIDLETFNQQLITLYETGQHNFSGLQQEAELIHQLWFAWHEQLRAQSYVDPVTAQILAMNNSLNLNFEQQHLHLIGLEPAYASQQDWLKKILNQPNVHLWIQGRPHAAQKVNRNEDWLYRVQEQLAVSEHPEPVNDPYQQAIDTIFKREPQIVDRAKLFRQTMASSPLCDRLQIFAATSAEHQVQAIDTQIRRWLLDGKRDIAVVTENRLLARRLRALLERADIQLHDAAGWTLATTRAAASIESLLVCIEEDFDKDAFLDLLKSELLFPEHDQQQLKKLIYRFEHDIIHNEQVTNSLMRYQLAITNRHERLSEIWSFSPTELTDLLDEIHQATQPLQQLLYKQHHIDQQLLALQETIEQLGMSASLQADPAGQMIWQMLEDMVTAARQQPLKATWSQFRSWLGRNFENRYFQPQSQQSPVHLFNLSQAGFQNTDGLIIAGLELEDMPGAPASMQFFNNQVRKQLQLPGLDEFRQQRLRQFSNLLSSSKSILLTYRSEQNGEPVIASPWLAAIEQFHQLAYGNNLRADELHHLLRQHATQVIRCDTTDLPGRQTQPRPNLPTELVPQQYSASSYQQLMDCPYQFFAAQCLQLKPPEEIILALSKREYGERVHLCLQAFHSDHHYYPGPFAEKITQQNRQQAINLMTEIAQAVFEYDMQQNFIHKGWYHQWLKVIPVYIDWHIENKSDARVVQTEEKLERKISDTLVLKGRLDRIDLQDEHYEVIDYKTGQLPTKKDVLAGERVQLPFYSLLTDPDKLPIESTGYLTLGKDSSFKAMFPLKQDELSDLASKVLERLDEMVKQMNAGHSLPAWENSSVCQYCDMITLCRCGTWEA